MTRHSVGERLAEREQNGLTLSALAQCRQCQRYMMCWGYRARFDVIPEWQGYHQLGHEYIYTDWKQLRGRSHKITIVSLPHTWLDFTTLVNYGRLL